MCTINTLPPIFFHLVHENSLNSDEIVEILTVKPTQAERDHPNDPRCSMYRST